MACNVHYLFTAAAKAEAQMKILRLFLITVTMSGLTIAMQGCAFTAGAVAGAAGSEALEEEGYDLQSPVTEDEDN